MYVSTGFFALSGRQGKKKNSVIFTGVNLNSKFTKKCLHCNSDLRLASGTED
jgi:hypothetical protein